MTLVLLGWFFFVANVLAAAWLFSPPRHWLTAAIGCANVVVAVWLFAVLTPTAQAADLVPPLSPDGYAVLVVPFPREATRVCIVRKHAENEPLECRPAGEARDPRGAFFFRRLEPGETVCAYSENAAGRSPLSEDCWVGPAEVKP